MVSWILILGVILVVVGLLAVFLFSSKE